MWTPGERLISNPEDARTTVTDAVTRGAARLFEDLGAAVVTEFRLATGRRADIAALHPDGRIDIVEVKSSREDFLSDTKWPEYQAFCDRFYFAVSTDFPMDILPDQTVCGVVVADAWSADIIHPAPTFPLAAARRRAVTIKLARTAAVRLRRLLDPRIE
jgi:hypothetical protein